MQSSALLTVTDLCKQFPVGGGWFSRPRGWVRAVNGVSFAIGGGESLGRVGESGCGKSTLARLIVRLLTPSSGSIRLHGQEIHALDRRALRPFRKRMQLIFQDPYASLDPRMTIAASVTEPLRMVEIARADNFHDRCRHPYTRALVDAVPQPNPRLPLPPVPVEGERPDSSALPAGCSFHPRCPHRFDPCAKRGPPLFMVDENHGAACWLNHEKPIYGGEP